MYYVIVYFNIIKDVFNRPPMRINHVTEHYCTEKMFYASCSDESSVYISLNEISKIEVFKEADED